MRKHQKLSGQKLDNYRNLWFAQCWFNLRHEKAVVVFQAAANALCIAHPENKSDGYEVLARFKAAFRYSKPPRVTKAIRRVDHPKPSRPAKPKHFLKRPAPVIDPNSDAFLQSYEWRVLRMVVLKKYGARCQCCGATRMDGVSIHVDHIQPRRKHPELALTESNLQVLCEVCNHGKAAWDSTDWRDDSQLSRESSRTPQTGPGDGDEQNTARRLIDSRATTKTLH